MTAKDVQELVLEVRSVGKTLSALERRIALLEDGHGRRISSVESDMTELRGDIKTLNDSFARLELGEERRQGKVMAELAALRLEVAETNRKTWVQFFQYAASGGIGGGAIGTGVFVMQQYLGG